MAEEEVLFEEEHVRVTTTQLQVGGATHRLDGISGVRRKAESPSIFPVFMGAGVGVLLAAVLTAALMPLLGMHHPLVGCGGGIGLFGSVAAGIAVTMLSPSTYVVLVRIGTGERRVFASRDKMLTEQVADAIGEALTRRE